MRSFPLFLLSATLLTLLSPSLGDTAANSTNSIEPVLLLSNDSSFHFQLIAALGQAIYAGGADINPVLAAAKDIIPGNMTSFSERFRTLAFETKKQAEDSSKEDCDPTNIRDTWFSASTYFRMADFYLHSNWTDPLVNSLWREQTQAFNKGLAALPIPGERVRIPATKGNFTVEAIWYAASTDVKRPTLIIGNGYDAAQEDSFHNYVVPALIRGWNCMTYEGPGQPTVRREQNVGFIPEWENVVTPVVDYLLSKKADYVDSERLALFGNSMGGYLAARAAAFEPRLSAVLLNGGVWDVHAAYTGQLPDQFRAMYEKGNATEFDETVSALRSAGELPTNMAWGFDQGLWSFHTHSAFDFLDQTKKFNLADVVDKINMPVWIADVEFEGFFPGQPKLVKEALGDKATLHSFTGAAGYHCEVGAGQEQSRVIFSWLSKTLGRPEKLPTSLL